MTNHLLLEERLDISRLEPLHESAADLLNASDDAIIIDASEVGTITTPALQLLLALLHTAKERSKDISINPVSASFRRAVDELGLTKSFQPWMAN